MLPLTKTTAADAYAEIRRHGRAIRTRGDQLRAQIDGGTVYPAFLLDVLATARAALAEVPPLADTLGLAAYIQNQMADPTLDLRPALEDCLGKLMTLVGAIVAEYPRDPATGQMLDRTLGADGAVVWGTIPAASMPQTSAALDAVLATLT